MRAAAWLALPGNLEKKRDDEARRRKNPEYRERARAHYAKPEIKERVRAYKAKQSTKYCALRRARKRNAPGCWSADDIFALLEKQDGQCPGCGAEIDFAPFEIDHIMPLARGGSNWPHNLQLLCPTCNRAKGNKTMDEWRSAVEAIS